MTEVGPVEERHNTPETSSSQKSSAALHKTSGQDKQMDASPVEKEKKDILTKISAVDKKINFKDHECSVITSRKRFFLALGSVLYCFDVFSDLYVALLTIATATKGSQYALGFTMLFFAIGPLAYCNYVAQKKRYNVSCFYGSNIKRKTSWYIDPEELRHRPFKRTLYPYPWDTPFHVGLNMLCIFQLGLLINSLEIFYHKECAIANITKQVANYSDVRKLEGLIENCPQLTLQIAALVISFGDDRLFNTAMRILSISVSLLSLPLSITADYESERLTCRTDYDFLHVVKVCGVELPTQILLMYGAYLTMISGRIMFIITLYLYLEQNENVKELAELTSVTFVSVILLVLILEIHHWAILAGNLLNRYFTIHDPKVRVVNEIKLSTAIISYYVASVSEVFVIMMNFPASYTRAVGPRAKNRAPRKRSLVLIYLLNLGELVVLAGLITKVKELQHLGLYFVPLYLLTGIFLGVYHLPCFNPDTLKQQDPYKRKREGRGVQTCRFDPNASRLPGGHNEMGAIGSIGGNIQEYITNVIKT